MKIRTYVSRRGDTVDYVVWRFYGTTAGNAVEQVLEMNPGLADHDAVLPAGVVIQLPPLLPADVLWEGHSWD